MTLKDKNEFNIELNKFINVAQSGTEVPGLIVYPGRKVDFYLSNTPVEGCVNYETTKKEAMGIVDDIDMKMGYMKTNNARILFDRASKENVNVDTNPLYFVLLF